MPLDPWRYYELGRAADLDYTGRGLDVSSPKLLTSMLVHEGNGEWLGIDLFEREIEHWRRVDPGLRLEVEDARALPYPDASFDHCLCISVVEHIAGSGDTEAMREMWRVLRPGGTLTLTTNVSRTERSLFVDRPVWGEASTLVDGKVFFERHYSPESLRIRLLGEPWHVIEREYAAEIDPSIHDRYASWIPWSCLWGALFRFRCPRNFVTSRDPDVIAPYRHGVVFLRLGKPGA